MFASHRFPFDRVLLLAHCLLGRYSGWCYHLPLWWSICHLACVDHDCQARQDHGLVSSNPFFPNRCRFDEAFSTAPSQWSASSLLVSLLAMLAANSSTTASFVVRGGSAAAASAPGPTGLLSWLASGLPALSSPNVGCAQSYDAAQR